MDIIKGSSVRLNHTIYSTWSGQAATSLLANITGATIKTYLKQRDGDADADAILTLIGAIDDAVNGAAHSDLAASDTNTLSYTSLVIETVTKLSDGSYIRSGVEKVNLLPNVGKTLF